MPAALFAGLAAELAAELAVGSAVRAVDADPAELPVGAVEQPASSTPPASIAVARTLRTWFLMSGSLAAAAVRRLRQST